MIIEPVAVLEDNYVWLVIDPVRREALVVDPGDGAAVLTRLRRDAIVPAAALLTHFHGDHTGGVADLLAAWRDLPVLASTVEAPRISAATRAVADGEQIDLLGLEVRCLHVPGHTRGAVAYHLPQLQAVFTGDTLFTCGCGRLFEGTPEQMLSSLRRLAALPPETRVYCGHEYTEKNLRFAASLLPKDAAVARRLADVTERRERGEPTVPESLAVELATNPFLRWDEPTLRAAIGTHDALATFTEVRKRRNGYNG